MKNGYWIYVSDHYVGKNTSNLISEENRYWIVFAYPQRGDAVGHGKTRDEAMANFKRLMRILSPLGEAFVPQPMSEDDAEDWYPKMLEFIPASEIFTAQEAA